MVTHNKTLVLVGVDLIDGLRDEVKADMTVIVEDGIISAIGKKDELPIPQDAKALDLTGKTIIPGLIDAHLHLAQSGVDDFAKPYAERMTTKLKRNSFLTIKSGVTTVRNMPGGSGFSITKFRDKVNSGAIPGPRILASGPALAPSYGYFSLKRFFPPNPMMISILSRIFGAHGLSIDVDTPEEAVEAVRKLKAIGVDFIKTVTPGAYIPFAEKDPNYKEQLVKKGLSPQTIEASMKPEVLQAIVDEAHKQGLRVAAHTVCWLDGFKEAVRAGANSLEHTPLELIDDETFEFMKKKGTFWVPTAYCFYNWSNLIDNPHQYETKEFKVSIPEPFYSVGKKALDKVRKDISSGDDLLWGRFYAEITPFKREYFPRNFSKALERGIKIVAAVDAGASGAGYVPHGQLYKELELFVDHGMSEFQAIQTATKNPAELLGVDKELGTLEVGKTGDIVVLDANPLADISKLKDVCMVIKEGRLAYSRE